jgi:hypothetical protein
MSLWHPQCVYIFLLFVKNYALMFGHHFNEIMYKNPSFHIEENAIRNILFGDNDEHIKSSCIKDS